MNNWKLNYAETDQWEWYHPDNNEHYLLIAQAGPEKDEEWYVLPYIGQLSPTDYRYDGSDRVRCASKDDAQKWADRYLENHPDGHDPHHLAEDQQSFNPETGKTEPVGLV